ncbi:hypothetical protein [Streptomyces sp. MST-110588]|uniref:hypothetical protein n=1 Tax=Streptomyces sp. MST-110588 TaxID=2833628 RepID=UPI001F5DD295|nr:hypothetical protein [Streptomyces sp. MST-110588]UNO43530.1 hypothetical protein KGS77_33715 [Streptomyces sp. MST-110588]
MGDERTSKDPREAVSERDGKPRPRGSERDRSAEEVNADRPSLRGEKPKRAPKR